MTVFTATVKRVNTIVSKTIEIASTHFGIFSRDKQGLRTSRSIVVLPHQNATVHVSGCAGVLSSHVSILDSEGVVRSVTPYKPLLEFGIGATWFLESH